MEVQVEVTPDVFADTVGALEQLQGKLSRSIETTVGARANVRLVQPRTIARSEGKAKRVIDQRKM
jgi:phenylacetate-CoA ligase